MSASTQQRVVTLATQMKNMAKVKLKTVDELMHLLDCELIDELPSEGFGKRLGIEQMRQQVVDLAILNIMYVQNSMQVDKELMLEVAGGEAFIEKPQRIFRQKGGSFLVGLRFRKKWLELKKGKKALSGIARDDVVKTITALAQLCKNGAFDKAILAIYDQSKTK